MFRRFRLGRLGALVLLAALTIGCKFPYPADVPDDDVSPTSFSVGGKVTGLWTGGAITLHISAGAAVEDLAVNATDPFTFVARLPLDTSYLVTVADDGPDHDCVVTNGSGMIEGTNITDLAVSCTNLIPHGIAISVPAAFTFDPRVTRYPLAVSLLQQETTVVVSGETLNAATVAGQPVTLGRPSAIVPLGQGQTTVPVVVTKGPWSQRYELVFNRGGTPIVEALYGRASNAGLGDRFGSAVAGSGDYLAIAAYLEDSSSELGNDDATSDSGAVYMFRRSGTGWLQTQILKGSAITRTRLFGASLAMDGNVLVVGASYDARLAGAAYVFRLDPTTGQWNQEQRITASDPHATDYYGIAVDVSGDTIAVGAPYHDAGSANTSDNFGLVYVYRRIGGTWIEDGRVRPPMPQTGDRFGIVIDLDGDTLATTYHAEAIVMRRSGGAWIQEPTPSATVGALALEGDVLAIGQPADPSGNGQPGDQSAPGAGAVRVFTRTGATWQQSAYLKAATPQAGAYLGKTVALRGNTIATGSDVGHALQVFERTGGSWVPAPPIGVSNAPAAGSPFGDSVALTRNGAVVTAGDDMGVGIGAAQLSGTAWFFR